MSRRGNYGTRRIHGYGSRLAAASTRDLVWLGGLWLVTVVVPFVWWLVSRLT